MALSTEWVALKTGQSGSGGVEYSRGAFFCLHGGKMKNHEPNQTTIEAIEEGKQMLDDPNTPSYSTTEELITALDK